MKITDSQQKRKVDFTPITAGKIKLYVCGVTVYDKCHIGHARTNLAFDVIVRFLRYRGFEVTFVRNITDIDDKIIKRANERGESFEKVVEDNIQAMYEDFDALNIMRPDIEPRATESIPQIIDAITQLMTLGFAYAADNGDVYYRVTKFQDYGKLSGQKIEDLQSGIRIAVDDHKENALDFVLWKAAKSGEPAWSSPWGDGRPGWHIECSAMTKATLGDQFDIHGGGSDLCFPHHENEIAQSMPINDGTYANHWLHSGMVQINGEKMSKSLNNFFVIRDVLDAYPAEVVRYFLTSAHYRSEINYSTDNLDSAKSALTRFYTALRDIEPTTAPTQSDYRDRFIQAMEDDFNTPEALAVMFDLVKAINTQHSSELAALLIELGGVLGILQDDPEHFLKGDSRDACDIDALIAERMQARAEKNWAESDRIRDLLAEKGILIEDGAGGTTWRRK